MQATQGKKKGHSLAKKNYGGTCSSLIRQAFQVWNDVCWESTTFSQPLWVGDDPIDLEQTSAGDSRKRILPFYRRYVDIWRNLISCSYCSVEFQHWRVWTHSLALGQIGLAHVKRRFIYVKAWTMQRSFWRRVVNYRHCGSVSLSIRYVSLVIGISMGATVFVNSSWAPLGRFVASRFWSLGHSRSFRTVLVTRYSTFIASGSPFGKSFDDLLWPFRLDMPGRQLK